MAYEDLNTKFRNTTKDLNSINAGIESIKAGLERFLQTPKGHDPFNREYGCSLYNLLFNTGLSINEIQMFVYMDITTFEPRISLSPVGIDIKQLDKNTYMVNCIFTIPMYNNTTVDLSTKLIRE